MVRSLATLFVPRCLSDQNSFVSAWEFSLRPSVGPGWNQRFTAAFASSKLTCPATLAVAGSYCRHIDLGLFVSTAAAQKAVRLFSVAHSDRISVLCNLRLTFAVWRGAFKVLSD